MQPHLQKLQSAVWFVVYLFPTCNRRSPYELVLVEVHCDAVCYFHIDLLLLLLCIPRIGCNLIARISAAVVNELLLWLGRAPATPSVLCCDVGWFRLLFGKRKGGADII